MVRIATRLDAVFGRLCLWTWPAADLLIRLSLARILLVSNAGFGVAMVAAVLLAAGFLTRYAAFALLLTVAGDGPSHAQLYWMASLAWYAIYGAGAVSFDSLLRLGLGQSAIPLTAAFVRFGLWLRTHAAQPLLLLLRLWLGGVPYTPAAMAVVCGACLSVGLGTRYVAAVLMLVASASVMMGEPAMEAMSRCAVLAILVSFGGGTLSVDRLLAAWVGRRAARSSGGDRDVRAARPHVVIVGAGFAGVSCAARLRGADVAVTVIDRTNYHLFQPLLYQVATAGLSPGDIAVPVRQLFRDDPGVRVLLGTVSAVDAKNNSVRIDDRQIPFDYLVLATGATHSYFGQPAWEAHAPGLKRVEDALEIRRRILTAFERAEGSEDADERAALLTFIVVGGGPTGVELAGAIAELARFGLAHEFRTFEPADARVLLIQSGARLLPAFSERLSGIAQASLIKLGVEVKLHSRVTGIDELGVLIDGVRVCARTVVWAAGVAASPAARWLDVQADAAGRIKVNADLSVPGFAHIFAVGDTAFIEAWAGRAVPGLAPAAKQGGTYVGDLIRARVHCAKIPPPFIYRHRGSLATIGRKAAVADFGAIRLWGAPAWWLWGVIHVSFLVGIRNRAATLVNWFWAYLTFRGIRLITGMENVRSAEAVVERPPAI